MKVGAFYLALCAFALPVFAANPEKKEVPMTWKAQSVSVSVNRSPAEVYAFASDPMNLPKWAAGLSASIKNVQGEWIADSPLGKVKVKFADKNTLGVLDHAVTLPSGEVFYNPMRVCPNQAGSEIIFTVYRRPQATDPEFAKDVNAVTRDLETLKTLLEKK
jgi:hypothetical protein